jgi:hypothetical protein
MDEIEGYPESPDLNNKKEIMSFVSKCMKVHAKRILQSRDRARNAAIAVLGCFSHGRSAAVGEKDVGRIIGRVIWASRGIKEWE